MNPGILKFLLQVRIQKPVENLQWCFGFAKIVNGYKQNW